MRDGSDRGRPERSGVLLDDADVVLGLGVRRDAAEALHGAGPGVVGGQGLRGVAAEGVELLLEVLGAAVEVLDRVEHVGHAQAGRGGGHQLRQTAGAGGRAGVGLKPDSCLTRPASSAGSRPLAFAAAVISAAYGVPLGSSDAPVAARRSRSVRRSAVGAGARRRRSERAALRGRELGREARAGRLRRLRGRRGRRPSPASTGSGSCGS